MKKFIYASLVSVSLLTVNAFAGQNVWVDAKKLAKKEAEKKCKNKGYNWAESRSNNFTKWECKGKSNSGECEYKIVWSSTKPDGNGDNQRADEQRCRNEGGTPSSSYNRETDETTVSCKKKVCK